MAKLAILPRDKHQKDQMVSHATKLVPVQMGYLLSLEIYSRDGEMTQSPPEQQVSLQLRQYQTCCLAGSVL